MFTPSLYYKHDRLLDFFFFFFLSCWVKVLGVYVYTCFMHAYAYSKCSYAYNWDAHAYSCPKTLIHLCFFFFPSTSFYMSGLCLTLFFFIFLFFLLLYIYLLVSVLLLCFVLLCLISFKFIRV